jgi:hypothetical protein
LLDVRHDDYPTPTAINEKLKVLPFSSSHFADPTRLASLKNTLKSLFVGLEDEFWLDFHDGLGEAMINVVHHAYPATHLHDFPVRKRWWMTGAIDQENQRLSAIIFDQGVSIPGHLPRSGIREKVRAHMLKVHSYLPWQGDKVDDGEQIEAAIEVSRSSTGEPGRGQGLSQVINLIENAGGGRVRILSRRGEYIYEKGAKPIVRNLVTPIGGTLIEWDVYR